MTRTSRLLALAGTVVACLAPAAIAAAATPTTTTVPAVTATVGTTTKLVATVTPASSSGSVRFLLDGVKIPGCATVLVTDGTAVCKTTFTTTATHTVVAKYSGTKTTAASQGSRSVTPVYGVRGQIVGSVGDCTKKAGALVAVSFGAWNGPVVRGCDTTLTTGIELLTTAGFTTAGTAHDGPAFICRIGHASWQAGTQYPTPATEACQATPPADAYWSYWLAPKGQNTWSYSPLGAFSDQPKPGEVEAWTFGATDIAGTTGQPSFTPNQVRAGLPAS